MTDDQRFTWGFILDVLNVLERHGYHRADNRQTGLAVEVIFDLARVCDGTLDTPGAYLAVLPSQPRTPEPSRPDAVAVPVGEVKTLLAALDEAAGYKRDRAAICADCADQSCGTCQWRLQAAQTYDRTAAQLRQTAAVSREAADRLPEPGNRPDIPAHPRAADKEAGQ
jgi:hypothetical protein